MPVMLNVPSLPVTGTTGFPPDLSSEVEAAP
jgi:hypothetical protein